MIHEFPVFTDLVLENRASFQEKFAELQPEISDFSFVDLFCWRKALYTKVSRLKGNLIVMMKEPGTGKEFFICPIGSNEIEKTFSECAEYLQKAFGYAQIYSIPRNILEKIKYTCKPDRNNFDYLYKVEDLVALKGPKYAGKRNFVKRFKSGYSYEYEKLKATNITGCKELLKEWCLKRNCREVPILRSEADAVNCMLDNMDELEIFGGVLKIENKVEAFTLASRLNKNTVQIHAEKADQNITGIYQAINQIFAEKELSKFEYINREQDMGVPGLRKAKESYHPCKLIEKYVMITS